MIEVLPIKVLTQEDTLIFGSLNVALGKLSRAGLPVASGIVVTPPNLKLKTILEHHDFGSREVFEQNLTLVKKEINAIAVPEILKKEAGKHNHFLVNQKLIKSTKDLWLLLLSIWIDQIKVRLWKDGFYKGITEGLEPQIVIFVKKVEALGNAYFDPIQDDTVINVKQGKLHPNDLRKLDQVVKEANKKLFIPHEYEWIVDDGIKLTGIKPFTQSHIYPDVSIQHTQYVPLRGNGVYKEEKVDKVKSAVKVFLDLSTGLVVEREVDGVYIASEKIFDLNKPRDSFEDLVFKLVESATTFPDLPVLFKLADKSEGMGKVRGTLRLLHQKSLFDPMVDALDFIRHKRGLTNVHIVIPFVRGVNEFLQIKRELAVKKLSRKNSLELWMEVAVPENIINLEDYLVAGLDGVILNLDELVSFMNGFDNTQEEMTFYKKEVNGLLKFLEDSLKLLHKSKIPFIAAGTLSLYPQVLEFLVEKGVYGIVAERYEAPSAKDLLHQTEKRVILKRYA